MTKTTSTTEDGPLRNFKFHDDATAVHWRVGNDGVADMRVTAHAEKPWLAFDTYERSVVGSSKRTMVTLDEEQGRAFYQWLKGIYEPK